MVSALSGVYNNAPVLVERNNHGHAVLLWLRDNAPRVSVLVGLDRQRGWQTNSASKSMLYTDLADTLQAGGLILRDFTLRSQLASIEGSTLSAPQNEHDDLAMALVLANRARIAQPVMSAATINW
jgi:hypothetical protein